MNLTLFEWFSGGTLTLLSHTSAVLTLLMLGCPGMHAADVPATPQRPVTEVYHGVAVTDDYRWLEDPANPEVKAWVAQQNAYSASILSRYTNREAIRRGIRDFFEKRSTTYTGLIVRAGRVFAFRRQPSSQQPSLVAFPSTNLQPGEEKVVLDPLAIDQTGSTTIDWFLPSTSARYVAFSLSKGGSERGDLHVYEVATTKELLADVVPRVHNGTAGGSAAWNGDDTGLYYTRYPKPGERPEADQDFYQQIYFHRLGGLATNDRYELGQDFSRISEVVLESSRGGKRVLASVENGDGGEYLHFLHTEDGSWRQITHYSDQITIAHFGTDDSLYLLSKKDAPLGKILHLPKSAFEIDRTEQVVPESDVAIDSFRAGDKTLYIAYLAGGPSEIRLVSTKGQALGRVPLDGIVSVDSLEVTASEDLLFNERGYIQFSCWRRYSATTRKVSTVAALSPQPAISFSDAEVVREFAVSKDGTRVPLNIIRKKGTVLNGKNPVLLTGYGGYGLSERPNAGLFTRLLLDHGVIFVTTNLRGGAEYGEPWHRAGNLTRKQNVFDDFYACAKYLVDHQYTAAERLGILGGSNGGLLMGAAFTQHPEMFRAVIAFVGIYDMLHVELSPNGAFNVTEFGTVKEQDQFRALYAYSPYHHVKKGVTYPAAIFFTGDNDPRVDPAQSRKMVARLQAAGPGKGPFLLRTSSNAGHGIGSSLNEIIAQETDAFSFLFTQLDVD